jgi:hypothetical protein
MAPPDKAKCQGARVLKSFDSYFERYSSSESEHSDYFSTALAAHWRTRPLPVKPFFFISLGDRRSRQKIVSIACLKPASNTAQWMRSISAGRRIRCILD